MRTAARARSLRRALPYVLLFAVAGAGLRVATSWTPRPRADFVFNNGAEIQSLDPATVTGIPAARILRHVYEGLTVKDPLTLAPRPGQARDWRVSEDGLSYTFRLRPDARWTNGDPVTAHDFVWSYRRLLHPRTAAAYAAQLWCVAGARAYGTWPPDRAAGLDTWVLPTEGRPPRAGDPVRLGVTPRFVRRLGDKLRRFQLAEGLVGRRVAAGDPLGRFFGQEWVPWTTPISGRVAAVHEALLDDPKSLAFETLAPESWIVAIEIDRAGQQAIARMPAGERYREEVLWPQVGIRAVDAHTLNFQLLRPTPYFLDVLSLPALFPVNREALESARERWPDRWPIEWTRPERLVTNGPFRIAERRVNDRIRMVKSPTYWDAENVAFRTIEALALDHAGTALNMYLTGACDWISGTIPADLAPRLREREDFRPAPFLGTYFYRINVTKPPLDDPLVRKALAMAIDRDALCETVTKAGQRAARGFVPAGMPGWVPQRFGPDSFEEARKLILETGYGSRTRKLPTIELLYNSGEAHRDIAEVVADGWRKIGFDVRLRSQEWKAFLDNQTKLAYDVSRSVWIADYADPTSFLDVFTSYSRNNRTGWANENYDSLIERAATTTDHKLRRDILRSAERILLRELPIIPIYYYTAQNLVNPRLGGFHPNLLDEHPPKYWYWMDDAELETERKRTRGTTRAVEAHGPEQGLYSPADMAERKAQRAGEPPKSGARAPGGAGQPDARRRNHPAEGPGAGAPRGDSEPTKPDGRSGGRDRGRSG